MLVFCEDCGQKHIVVPNAGDQNATMQFRCTACDYPNVITGNRAPIVNKDYGSPDLATGQDRARDKPSDSDKH